MFRKSDPYLVALLWKMICNLGDPMSLRHPVPLYRTWVMARLYMCELVLATCLIQRSQMIFNTLRWQTRALTCVFTKQIDKLPKIRDVRADGDVFVRVIYLIYMCNVLFRCYPDVSHYSPTKHTKIRDTHRKIMPLQYWDFKAFSSYITSF